MQPTLSRRSRRRRASDSAVLAPRPRAANGQFVRVVDDEELPADRFLDREISWLHFNERVLGLAEDAAAAAAGAGPVPGHLREQPGRVLHGPRGRAQAPDRDRPGPALGVRPGTPRGARADLPGRPRADGPAGPDLHGRGPPRAGARGHHAGPLGRALAVRAGAAGHDVPRAGLPGADAAGRRPGAPLPLHLRPVAQPGRGRGQPQDRDRAVRPGQGAAAAAAVRAGRGPGRPCTARWTEQRRPTRRGSCRSRT